MNRYILVVFSILLILSFTSCQNNSTPDNETTKATAASQETESTNPTVEYAEEIANIEDFKCVCQIDYGDSFVIEGDNAKALYTYLKEQEKSALEATNDSSEQKPIKLIFQDGEPVILQGHEPVRYPLVLDDPDSVQEMDLYFYGDYVLFEDDYISVSASPATSFAEYLKFPNGTYSKVKEMISE